MARTTIGDIVSRIRREMKAVNQDAFLTDRFIFSVVKKHASWLMKREDGAFKLMKFNSVFDTLDFVELIEIDKIQASCTGIKSDCTIKRTKEKLPSFMEGYWGPLIRSVNSLDGSERVLPTDSNSYTKMANSKNFKYNNNKYYWFINDHCYFPNLDWDAVMVEGIYEDDISSFKCNEGCDESTLCLPRQAQNFNVPDYLHGELETNVLKEMGLLLQYPVDPVSDKINPLR